MMKMQLDHVAISGETRALATDWVEAALGVPLQTGGTHAHFGTHNTLLGLEDGLYLEAISIDPDASPPAQPRWFSLDQFTGAPRLTNWICRVDNLAECLARFPEAGEVVSLRRGELKWQMAVPASGDLPFDGVFPALIEWNSPHPTPALTQQGVRLTRLDVCHPEAEALKARLSGVLDAPLVSFRTGPAGLRAEFDTPQGARALTSDGGL